MAKKKKSTHKKQKKDKLDSQRVGLTLGIFTGFAMLMLALMSNFFGWGRPIVTIIGSLYLGYDLTLKGMIVGIFWGFIDGFIGGYLFAWLYNKLGN